MLTPGKHRAIHNLHGTIYDPIVDSGDPNIIYHCHAAVTKEAKAINPVWTIWREDLTTGKLVNPIDPVTGNPKPDNNACDDVENLTYWQTFEVLTLVLNSSGDPIENSNNDEIFT
jgi:hypothetical protein